MNNDFESELRQALARMEPPENFAERVLDRLPTAARKQSRRQAFLMAMAAMLVLAASLALYWRHQQEERERVREVQQQLVFALRLTAEKLTVVEARLKRSAPRLRMRKEQL